MYMKICKCTVFLKLVKRIKSGLVKYKKNLVKAQHTDIDGNLFRVYKE